MKQKSIPNRQNKPKLDTDSSLDQLESLSLVSALRPNFLHQWTFRLPIPHTSPAHKRVSVCELFDVCFALHKSALECNYLVISITAVLPSADGWPSLLAASLCRGLNQIFSMGRLCKLERCTSLDCSCVMSVIMMVCLGVSSFLESWSVELSFQKYIYYYKILIVIKYNYM